MTHYSKVADAVFKQIKRGDKIIEPRLNDAEHRNVRIGDLVIIINRDTKQEVVAKVVGLLRHPNFDALFAAFPARYFGAATAHEAKQEVMRWYNPELEAKHGVLGIKLHLLTRE